MKFFVGLLLVVAIGSSIGFPATDPIDVLFNKRIRLTSAVKPCSKESGETDTDAVQNWKFPGVVDTYDTFPITPFSIGTPDFNLYLSRVYNRIRMLGEQSALDFDSAEEGNTTSNIKVINGHKFEWNETVYEKKEDFGHRKLTVISLQQLDSSEESDVTTTDVPTADVEEKDTYKGSPEVFENNNNNEINKNPDSSESTTEMHDITTLQTSPESDREIEDLVEKFIEKGSEENEKFGEYKKTTEHQIIQTTQIPSEAEDLAETFADEIEMKDTTKTLETSDFKIEELPTTQMPDVVIPLTNNNNKKEEYSAEDFNEESITKYRKKLPLESEISEEFGDYVEPTFLNYDIDELNSNRVDDKLDTFESIPIDLSNDIAVNQMLADQGAPINPDAEVFDPMMVPSKPAISQPYNYQPFYHRYREYRPRSQSIWNSNTYWHKK